jgi:hypothetical protein
MGSRFEFDGSTHLRCGVESLADYQGFTVVNRRSTPIGAGHSRLCDFLVGPAPISHTPRAMYLYRTGVLLGAAILTT